MGDFSETLFCEELRKRRARTDRQILVRKTIGSTSTELVKRVRSGCGAGTVIVADVQTSGRGRQGNIWFSKDNDSLYISLVVAVEGGPAEALPLVPLAAGVAAVRAIREHGFSGAFLKWPNDVLVDGAKMGGILCEVPDLSARPLLAVVGFGLNLGALDLPVEDAGKAVSLASVIGSVLRKESVAAAWVSFLESRTKETAELVGAWRECAEAFGRRVKVGDLVGTTVDLNDLGQLLIKKDNGITVAVPGGIVENLDCFRIA